jgi:hypothetical protein
LSVAYVQLLANAFAVVAETSKCGLYLAPLSIPGAGMGIFVGDRPIAEGEPVSMGDILIPITEYEWHNSYKDAEYSFISVVKSIPGRLLILWTAWPPKWTSLI